MVNVTVCTSKKCNQIHSLWTSDMLPAYASTFYVHKLCTFGKDHATLLNRMVWTESYTYDTFCKCYCAI